MKTLYISRRNILIDSENNSCDSIPSSRAGIEDIYLAKEPMRVVYGLGNCHKEADVEAGDIIVTFYVDDFKTKMIVVKNEEWADIILDYEKKQQEEKERWAAKNQCDNCEAPAMKA